MRIKEYIQRRLIKACKKYSVLLDKRFKSNYPTSEDWIRYSFYETLSNKLNLSALDFSFEVSFADDRLQAEGISENCELDALINIGNTYYAFEIKFLRETIKGKNSALPQNTGYVFNDINRLSHIKAENVEKFMLYVADERFGNYLSKPRNNVASFFELKGYGPTLDICSLISNEKLCKTFKESATKSKVDFPSSCIVQSVYSKDFVSGYHLRVLQVLKQ